ncbi:serine-threonine protein kinase, putative [Entamoeba invadens IP1]|uniref:Serine-threonine protein kinase, putative n=1 Tax=Entamoeba invadens IP1 TaxID=370355 RepID=A0A0A1UBU5_ENTIV|nr:serine-threonine protein kinase, putative [Entamoeba invadens IP1]ELP89779.1 serine-threonine protein kinase, putative [Entamoeba invadens IP1]|eukprot:XP_004256550.1 serine-threonine protein kinase, putative [Entamoeba invadens IP1]
MVLVFLLVIFSIETQGTVENCVNEFTTGRCIECEQGYSLSVVNNPNGGVPLINCSPSNSTAHCETEESGVCKKCADRYYLNNNNCLECPSNCLLCDQRYCFKCSASYYLSIDQKYCTQCTGTNASQCGQCDNAKYFSMEEKKCKGCSDNCAMCTGSDNCFQCTNKYYLNGTYNCLLIENCDQNYIKPDHCEKCKSGYRLEMGHCVLCTTQNCSECYLTTLNNEKCRRCKPNTILTNEGVCKTADELRCKDGSETYGCQRCVDGYYLDSQMLCTHCDEICGTCITTKTNCLTCNTKYYFSNGTCIPVDPNCKKYDQSGCKECNNVLISTGYFVDSTTKECILCNENCSLCEGEKGHCTACLPGYLLTPDVNNKYYTCEKQGDSCKNSSMGFCTQCAESYFIGLGMQCIKCNTSCASCESETACLSCAYEYYRGSEGNLCSPYSEINMTCDATPTGCAGKCKPGFFAQNSSQINCTACDPNLLCKECTYNADIGSEQCKTCMNESYYVKDSSCVSCSKISHCLKCNKDGCAECEDGYKPDQDSCNKDNNTLIISISIVVGFVVLLLLVIFVALISWRIMRQKSSGKNAKPFKVTNDLELSLLAADNKNFPLKMKTWELNFGLDKTKAVVDESYTETIQIANITKKTYFFEVLATPSHRYSLDIEPPRYTLKSNEAITIEFRIKMLCTSAVSDDIGIIAMDIEGQNKETAKVSLLIESDLSLKLDHTELIQQLPPIGEGGFGIVFRGTYRGRDVAIKKMKSRNMTEEQEKEFNHEVSMLKQLRHQCVVEFIGAVYTEGEISIVSEFAEYGALSKIWAKNAVSYDLKVKVLDDLAVALQFLHNNQIIHRDVKGENVLIFSLNPHSAVCGKLTDFGTCRNISDRSVLNKDLTQGIGTPTYMSPECLSNQKYSYPVDVYAFGITMYETFIEGGAYTDEKVFDQPWKIPQFVSSGKRLERPDKMNDQFWELTTSCWDQDPETRPTFTDILKTVEGWNLDIKYALLLESDSPESRTNVATSIVKD